MPAESSARSLVAGRGLPLREDDVDTDRIIPARYMKGISFEGLGDYAFRDALSTPESSRKALVTGLWDSTAELLPGAAAARALASRLPYLGWARAGT